MLNECTLADVRVHRNVRPAGQVDFTTPCSVLNCSVERATCPVWVLVVRLDSGLLGMLGNLPVCAISDINIIIKKPNGGRRKVKMTTVVTRNGVAEAADLPRRFEVGASAPGRT